jgi:hypothetical protein
MLRSVTFMVTAPTQAGATYLARAHPTRGASVGTGGPDTFPDVKPSPGNVLLAAEARRYLRIRFEATQNQVAAPDVGEQPRTPTDTKGPLPPRKRSPVVTQ